MDDVTEQPVEGQDLTTLSTEEVQSPSGDQGSTGAWSLDSFDESVRPQVDEFLRESVQPYVTKLEQSGKTGSELIEALQEDPSTTLLGLAQALYDEEEYERFSNAFLGSEPEAAEVETDAEESTDQPESWVDGYKEFIEASAKEKETAARDAEYQDYLETFSEVYPDVKTNLIHPFLHVSDMDHENAVSLYRGFVEEVKKELFPDFTGVELPNAPAVLTPAGNPAPATASNPATLDDAMKIYRANNSD